MPQPKLSIVTVCYNAASTIEAAINSVLSQTFKDFEYVIIDGASTDGTIEIVKKYGRFKNVRYVSEKDSGVFDAMNKAIRLAFGEWIYFLGSDDVFFDNQVLDRIFGNKNFESEQIVYGNVKFLHSGIIHDGAFNHEKISTGNICHQALFAKKTIFDKTGFFDCKYKMSADFVFNLKWMGQNIPSVYIDEIIAVYNEKGMSGQVWDEVFYYDFDRLLIENNIVSQRSFSALKRMNEDLRRSNSYKVSRYLRKPFTWIKMKIAGGNSR